MKSSQSHELEKQLREFKLNHYKNLDIGYWFYKVEGLNNKFNRLKDPVKRDRLIMELYATYLQLLEVLFINAYAVSRPLNSFPHAIFIDSQNIQEFIKDSFLQRTEFSNWFMTNYIFAIQENEADYQERFADYENVLLECAKDYLDNYQLLNAYKHGYRVVARQGKNSISLVDRNGENPLSVECDCEITYFSKEKLENAIDPALEGTKAIFKRRVSFNNSRIFGKAAFVITLLQNVRLTVIHSTSGRNRQKVLQWFLDKQTWKDSFGEFSFKQPLFGTSETKKAGGKKK